MHKFGQQQQLRPPQRKTGCMGPHRGRRAQRAVAPMEQWVGVTKKPWRTTWAPCSTGTRRLAGAGDSAEVGVRMRDLTLLRALQSLQGLRRPRRYCSISASDHTVQMFLSRLRHVGTEWNTPWAFRNSTLASGPPRRPGCRARPARSRAPPAAPRRRRRPSQLRPLLWDLGRRQP